MSQNFELAKTRLDNISAIEPLLAALRTMSMGTWQIALNKVSQMKSYEENYKHVIAEILPTINERKLKRTVKKARTPEIADTIILIIGTERGLCGKFNDALIENSLDWLDKLKVSSHKIWAMGSRLIQKLGRLNIDISWGQSLPTSELVSYKDAYLITQNWIEQFEAFEFNQFFILTNQLGIGSQYKFSPNKLLPYEIQGLQKIQKNVSQNWPPPIIETDPKGIYHQIIQHFIAASFYEIMLKSSAAEHAARFNLMQKAKDNAEEIIEELLWVINSERKRKITRQMQELAVGAGLLENI